MLILAGSIRIAEGKRAAALAPIQRMVEATRQEAGCLAYALSFDALDEHLVRIFEVFTDEAALAVHRASAHMAAWRSVMPSLGISERDMSQYDVASVRRI
jgi:quinol monooxygenase YgiN